MAKEKKVEIPDCEMVGSSYSPIGSLSASTLSSTSTDTTFLRPTDYASKCKLVWNDYNADPLVRYLIDRMSHFGINGTQWQLENKKEESFWSEWGRSINRNIIDVIPGLDEVEKWIFKNLAITGMSSIQWEWGTMSLNKVTYNVPIRMNVLPSSDMKLKNKSGKFGQTEVSYTNSAGNKVVLKINEGQKGSFLIKLNYSPADMTASGKSVTNTVGNVISTLYPEPPFLPIHEDVTTRLKLREIDRDTVEKFLEILWIIKVGNEEYHPQPPIKDENGVTTKDGTITKVAKQMKDSAGNRTGATRSLFVPYYVDIIDKTPNAEVLLNYSKYLAPTLNILSSFGIFMALGDDGQLNFTKINVQNFEQFIEFIRKVHIQRFIEGILCREIVLRNSDKLKTVPSLSWAKLNTKSEEFRKGITELLDKGEMSAKEALQHFGSNLKVVKEDIIQELKSEEFPEKELRKMSIRQLFNLNVPVSFKQSSSTSDDEEKITETPATNKGGRPPEVKTKEE